MIVDHLRVRCKMVWLMQPPEGRLFFLGRQRTRLARQVLHRNRGGSVDPEEIEGMLKK